MCLGVPGRIISAQGEDLTRSGRVDFGGVVREVSLAYVPEAGVGDWVVVHVGFAIATVDEVEAERTLALVRELDAEEGRVEAGPPPRAGSA